MNYTAAFYEVFEEEEAELRKFLPPEEKYFFTSKTIQAEHRDDEPPSKIISIRTQSRIPDNWAVILEAIITRSTGYDHITDYLQRNSAGEKIAAAYLPDYAARAVAEHAMMLWTALLRKSQEMKTAFENFYRDSLTGREIQGRKIAVIGVGRIGSQIIDIASGLKMDYVGVDIVEREELKEKYNLKYLPLLEAISRSEIIVSALPLTEQTKGLLRKDIFLRAPSRAIFVNVGRGEVVSNSDLLELLERGILSGIGLDVFNYEKELAELLRDKKPINNFPVEVRMELNAILKMKEYPNCIFTPHNAFNTEESVLRKSQKTAENLISYLKSGKFISSIEI